MQLHRPTEKQLLDRLAEIDELTPAEVAERDRHALPVVDIGHVAIIRPPRTLPERHAAATAAHLASVQADQARIAAEHAPAITVHEIATTCESLAAQGKHAAAARGASAYLRLRQLHPSWFRD